MNLVELMTVEDAFEINRADNSELFLSPNFKVPGGSWEDVHETVCVITPGGRQKMVNASFGMVHFNIRDPKSKIEERWRVVVSLKGVGHHDVPEGSRILASSAIVRALRT
jgi:hypothetical protein